MLCIVMSTKRHYITMAIDYPNAAPHMGHNSRKANLTVFLPWTILSFYGVAPASGPAFGTQRFATTFL